LKSFPPIPRMVAERNRVGACGKEFFVDRLRYAEALVGGVFAIDDAQINLPLRDAARKMSADRLTTNPSDDIANDRMRKIVSSVAGTQRRLPPQRRAR
jgi:hypothetical protein